MKRIFIVFCAALALFLLSAPSWAEDSFNPVQFQETLNDLNRLKPLQNPVLEQAQDTLNRKIIDRQNRIIGSVKDVIITREDGTVRSLHASFEKMRLTTPVFLNYKDMKIIATANSYQLGFKDTEIASLYPKMLATIETASGHDTDVMSVQRLLDAPVISPDGRKIGKIQTALFGKANAQIQSFYLLINIDTIRNAGVAIPFASLSFTEENGIIKAKIPQDQANFILDYVRNI